jgi:hypothetical protein
MQGHRITSPELREIKRLAAAGATKTVTASVLGITMSSICYWAEREDIAFQKRKARSTPKASHPAEADLEAARLRRTMQALRAPPVSIDAA